MSTPKSDNTRDNEQNKFVNDSKGDVAVNTVTELVDGSFSDVTGDEPSIYNVNMIDALTEYSLLLPVGTNRIKLKIKDNLAKFDISYSSGGPTFSVTRGAIYEETGLDLTTNRTIYFKSNKDAMVMEVIIWK